MREREEERLRWSGAAAHGGDNEVRGRWCLRRGGCVRVVLPIESGFGLGSCSVNILARSTVVNKKFQVKQG
ncbi:hypothetical protein Hanom_Chr12g01123091 [Helianthus anomalus]